MDNFRELSISDLTVNPFTKIGKQWMLITAGTPDSFNTMTASWGGLGVLWNKNVAFTFIRPQRYTFGFVEDNDCFSLCFFDEKYRSALSFCGSHSGRDCNKAAQTGLTVCFADGVPYFEQAELVLVCKKFYAQDLSEDCALADSVRGCYASPDEYHRMYVSEIVRVLSRV